MIGNGKCVPRNVLLKCFFLIYLFLFVFLHWKRYRMVTWIGIFGIGWLELELGTSVHTSIEHVFLLAVAAAAAAPLRINIRTHLRVSRISDELIFRWWYFRGIVYVPPSCMWCGKQHDQRCIGTVWCKRCVFKFTNRQLQFWCRRYRFKK